MKLDILALARWTIANNGNDDAVHLARWVERVAPAVERLLKEQRDRLSQEFWDAIDTLLAAAEEP